MRQPATLGVGTGDMNCCNQGWRCCKAGHAATQCCNRRRLVLGQRHELLQAGLPVLQSGPRGHPMLRQATCGVAI